MIFFFFFFFFFAKKYFSDYRFHSQDINIRVNFNSCIAIIFEAESHCLIRNMFSNTECCRSFPFFFFLRKLSHIWNSCFSPFLIIRLFLGICLRLSLVVAPLFFFFFFYCLRKLIFMRVFLFFILQLLSKLKKKKKKNIKQ